jgi:cytoskeletal protein RodZ
MPGLGDEFRAAREARHLSLSDVSEHIHIRSVYLQSIEDEEWSVIAAPVYVRGFVRTYARFLGLDPEHSVELFNTSIGELAARPHEPVALGPIDAPRKPSVWLLVAAAVAAILVLFVGFRYFQYQQDGGEPAAVAVASAAASAAASVDPGPGAATPVPHQPTPAPSPSGEAQALELSVTAPSWLLVKVDGAQVLQGIMPAGTHKSFRGKFAYLRVGNAGGVDVKLNGKELGKLGESGAVIERKFALSPTVQ